MVRHVLSAWCLLFAALFILFIPYAGYPLSMGISILGLLASGRLALYGFWRLSFLLGFLFSVLLVAVPWLWYSWGPNGLRTFQEDMGFRPRFGGVPQSFQAPQASFPAGTLYQPALPPVQPAIPPPWPAPSVASWSAPQPTIIQPEPPTDPKQQLHADAFAVVDEFLATKRRGDFEALPRLHVEHPVVFGSPLEGQKLLEALGFDRKYWSDRKEEINGEMLVDEGPDGACTIRFQTKIDLGDGPEIQLVGERNYTFGLRRTDGKFLIENHDYRQADYPKAISAEAKRHALASRAAVFESLEAESKGEIERAVFRFVDPVTYFGKTRSWEEVRKDKFDYSMRWPVRREVQLGSAEVTVDEGQTVTLKVPFAFRVENPEKREWKAGRVLHLFKLRVRGDGYEIIEQGGTVTGLEGGEIESLR